MGSLGKGRHFPPGAWSKGVAARPEEWPAATALAFERPGDSAQGPPLPEAPAHLPNAASSSTPPSVRGPVNNASFLPIVSFSINLFPVASAFRSFHLHPPPSVRPPAWRTLETATGSGSPAHACAPSAPAEGSVVCRTEAHRLSRPPRSSQSAGLQTVLAPTWTPHTSQTKGPAL